MDSGLKLFETVYPGSNLLITAKKIVNAGGEFEVNFYNVLVKKDGKVIAKAMLPKSTSSLLKGNLKEEDKGIMTGALLKMLDTALLYLTVGTKGVELLTPAELSTPVSDWAFSPPKNLKISDTKKPKESKEPKPDTSGKVKLANATTLLQPVFGTSPGSTYYTVALGETMKLALRRNGGSLSFRAEGLNGFDIVSLLSDFAFSAQSAEHMSLHVNIDKAVLRSKMYGSVVLGLMGMGVKFTKFIPYLNEIPEEE